MKENMKIRLKKIVGNFSQVRYFSFENCKWMERSSRIFSHPQVIENPRQYLLLRIDILQKTVVECHWQLSSRFVQYRFSRAIQRGIPSLGNGFSYNQWRIQGRGPGCLGLPLFFDQNEARRETAPHLISGSGWRPLPHYLEVWIRHW